MPRARAATAQKLTEEQLLTLVDGKTMAFMDDKPVDKVLIEHFGGVNEAREAYLDRKSLILAWYKKSGFVGSPYCEERWG